MLCLCLLFVLSAVFCFGKDPQLHGRVLDPSKAPIAQASISVSSTGGKTIFQGAADSAGNFTVGLAPGKYQLHVRKDGFTDENTPIEMSNVDKQITVALSLKTETISVTVSDQSAKLETVSDSHQDALKLNADQLGGLPIRDGDVISAITFFANPAGGQAPTIIVDGMERTDSVTLSPSQVQEVRLNNNAYSAEFPKAGKDRIEIDTKSGTDALHGGFVFRTRNSIFDARNPLAATKPPFARNGYEANLNSPVLRKRLFFFIDADRENQQQVQPIVAYLLTGLLQQEVLAPFTRNLLVGRLGWQSGEGHRVSAKYEFHQDEQSNIDVGGFVLPQAAISSFHRGYRIELSDQYVISPTLINNFRLALGTNYERLSSLDNSPSIIVPGSFQQGGAQKNAWRREPRYEFQDAVSWVKGSLILKGGAEARLHPFESFSADNFGGTYQFASLATFEANQPLLFTLNTGNPLIVSSQDDYAWFLQSEKQFGRMTLFAGVRHEFQSHLDRYSNLAPRVAAAIALDRSCQTVLRVGAGIFYDRRPPTILQQSERFNGVDTLQYIIENPSFSENEALLPGQASQSLTTTYPIDPSMTLPRIYQASATFERQLPGGLVATADFTYQRGTHLFRTRNINAHLPVTLLRPDTNQGNVDQIESSASSRGEIFNVTVKSSPKKRYQLFAQYALSYLWDDTSAVFGPPPPGGLPPGVASSNLFSLPANNYDLRPEWGPADNDTRHQLGIGATVELPWRFRLGTLTSVHSGLPYNINTGFDNNHDTDPNDRPPGVTSNTGRGAGYFAIDLHLARPLTFEEWRHKLNCEFAVDSFNVLNHANPSTYVGVQTSPLFGLPNAAYNGRELQFSVQARF